MQRVRSISAGKSPPRGMVRRFARDEGGNSAIEFAIVGLPFLLLLIAIFQLGLTFFQQEMLQTAVTNASRLVLTGQASAYTQAQFNQAVCNQIGTGLLPCSTIAVDVRQFDSFSSATVTKPVNSSGAYDPSQVAYTNGQPQKIMVVTAFALQPVLFPIMAPYASNAGTGQVLLQASAAFRNEPYSS